MSGCCRPTTTTWWDSPIMRLSVEPEHARMVWPGGGRIGPTVVVDGLVRGVWRRDRTRAVVLDLFDGAPADAAWEGPERGGPERGGPRRRDPRHFALSRCITSG